MDWITDGGGRELGVRSSKTVDTAPGKLSTVANRYAVIKVLAE